MTTPTATATTETWFDLPEWHDQPRRVKPIPGLGLPPKNNQEWPAWYDRCIARRIEVYRDMVNPKSSWDTIRREAALCKLDGRYWVNIHAGIYESRVDEDEEPGIADSFLTPFVLYPFQDYIWGWLEDRFRIRGRMGDGVLLKSRDMGCTNLLVAYYCWRWFATAPFQARLLSRNEDAVDDRGSTDSMFWKAEYFLKSTYYPLLLTLVPGFSWLTCRKELLLAHPTNANALKGESTNRNAGRGQRATSIGLDEFSFCQNAAAIWQSTRAASRHRIVVTSASTFETMFVHDLVEDSLKFPQSRKPAILRVYNSLHPFHDAEWLANERERDSEEAIQQEIFMNWFADESRFVFPALGPKSVGDFPYLPYAGPLFCAIDDGWDDDWAMLWIQYIEATGRHRVVEAYKNSKHVAKFYGSIAVGIFDGRHHYGEREREVMAKTQLWPQPIYIGDTHGRNKEQTSGLSPHEVLQIEYGITVNVDYNQTRTIDKIQAVGDIVDLLDWNATDGVRVALSDSKRYAWKKLKDNAELTSEYKEPAHGKDSHSPQALMFYAVNFHNFRSVLTGGVTIYYQDEWERVSSDPKGDEEYARQALERSRTPFSYADIR